MSDYTEHLKTPRLFKKHPYEGPHTRVLCICTGGLLRSPTAAWLLGQAPYFHNTRSAGIDPDISPVLVTQILVDWADEILCMEGLHRAALRTFELDPAVPVHVLDIPDRYAARDPELVELIRRAYAKRGTVVS